VKSGIFLLQNQQWQQTRLNATRDAYLGIFPETKRALEVMGRLASALRKDIDGGTVPEEGLPIFFMQTLYQATAIAMEMRQRKPDKDIQEKIDAFRWLLQYFCMRWNVASKSHQITFLLMPALTIVDVYLDILNAKEAFHDFDNLRHIPLYHEKEFITY
jgi:hypothetical protein